MDRVIRIYLYILPFYSLLGIILSAFRTAYAESYTEYVLLAAAILDLLILMTGWKKLFNSTIGLVLLFMLLSLLVGLLNNELSRRFITDFTNPFFFFGKIFVFKLFWKNHSFHDYFLKYYIKITFWGSVILLPIVYFIFSGAGATRMSIFPPLELPFSYFMQTGGIYFFVSLIAILLYGKRAQLIGAVFTFFLYILVFKNREIIKYIIITILGIFALSLVLENYSDNYAIRRLLSTFDQVEDRRDGGGIEGVAGSRAVEVESILREMNHPIDYIFGKGFGFEYHFEFNETNKMHANAHFTPIALLSKYGLFFTLFFYLFIFSVLFKFQRRNFDSLYFSALGACFFVFFESFFAYAIFVTPIFPISLGYLLFRQSTQQTDINV